jgi:threonine/homoserine efflux transporter RhtA
MKFKKTWVMIVMVVLTLLVLRDVVNQMHTGSGVTGSTWGLGFGVLWGSYEFLWKKKSN